MAIVPKQLVIVGAGKIAKSYLADIFGVDAGYHIVFLTHHACHSVLKTTSLTSLSQFASGLNSSRLPTEGAPFK